MKLEAIVTSTMLRQVLRRPEGRALLLAQAADAEDNGEAAMFDQAIELVDDHRFRKMIARHQADEVRHGRMFRERAERQGVDVGPLPLELRALEHVNEACDGFFARPLSSTDDVVWAFAVLQALEERAVVQFPFYASVIEAFDPESARVFTEIVADEQRHLLYCRAITRHYEPDPARLAELLDRARRLEAIAFRKTEALTAKHIDRLGIISNPLMRIVWRTLTSREAAPQPAFELLAA